ncbi:MAG: NADH dehydrogenase (quinone) subunit D [candidate division Zixibacteria bacterium]|nr:NADH dehydrogenase (quinone) subunit D [candidate division Zixibacteria bacterium]
MDQKLMTINLGPQHPATHGVLRVVLDIDGETVVGCRPEVGYLHTGIEKTAEAKLYYKAIPLTDRMDYLAPMSNNLGYCLAVEKLLGVEIPPKAQWARVLLAEATRINSHLVWLGTHALDIGALSMVLYAFREREDILKIYEAVSGQRMMSTYFRIGGLAEDLPEDFGSLVQTMVTNVRRRLQEYEDILTNNRIWRNRTIGVGRLTKEEAIKSGVTGPLLRASGVKHDLRKARPYSSYEKFEFEVPTSDRCDCFGRYEVRMEEMRQSLRIIEQALAGMPDGRFRARAPGVVLPTKEETLYSMEALIYHFKLTTEGFSPPPGEVYVTIESPKGEIGFYMVSDGSPMPYRMRVRPPSFVNIAALPKLVVGRLLADVIACIGSIDIVLGEVDR